MAEADLSWIVRKWRSLPLSLAPQSIPGYSFLNATPWFLFWSVQSPALSYSDTTLYCCGWEYLRYLTNVKNF